jgi:hypothetical protein
MSDTRTRGGFTGDPTEALSVAGSSGCCGNPPQSTGIALPEVAGSPCCGTPAEARATGSCCGATAKADAVTSGAGCCG